MKKNIYVIVLFLLSALPILAHQRIEANEAFAAANAQYAKGDFVEAAAAYESILDAHGESAELYYNLGNAYYKSDELGLSILNYERALRLRPFYIDAKYNLQLAQYKIVDKIEGDYEFFIKSWVIALMNLFPSNTWAWVSAALFGAFLLLFFVFAFGRKMWMRKLGFRIGVAFFILSVIGVFFTVSTKNHFEKRSEAIVLSGITTVKSSPDDSGTDLFVIHEGTKVHVMETLGDWYRVKFGNGNVGWVPVECVDRI